jgi:hypothetical protein
MRRRRLVLTLAVLLAAGLAGAFAMREPPVPVTTEEVVPPGEADAILRLVRKATAVVAQRSIPDHFYKRDAHAQPHGCVIAQLSVDGDLAAEYRHGIFRAPGRTYKTWVRFSNGTASDDRDYDARGMAIKVMGVRGPKILADSNGAADPETQDFLMINYHTFFVPNVVEYEKFFDYQAAGDPFGYFIGWNPLRWHLHGLYHAARMQYQNVASPLAAQYFSMSPYRLGARNVKFSAEPCAPLAVEKPAKRGPHYLRDALVAELRATSACFEFLIQLQDPTKNMPIEDPSIEWRQSESPYRRVAQLVIPRQNFSTDAQNRFCENLSFSPFHSLVEHRPIGGINRSRRAVYEAVSKRRHYHNATVRAEPRGWCIDLAATSCAPQREVRPLDGGSG